MTSLLKAASRNKLAKELKGLTERVPAACPCNDNVGWLCRL